MASPDVNNGATTSVRNVRFLTMFDEDISDFTSGDVTVTNGTLVGFDVETFYSSFTFTIVPTAAGPVTVTIATGVLSDDIGNPNTAATYTFTYSPAVS